MLDLNFFGIPKEGFALSNDAKPFFGPPTFKDAAVSLGSRVEVLTLRISY